MQFDSQAQKTFVIECFKKYPCTIEQALTYINAYSAAITAGKVVIEAKKDDQDTPNNPPVRIPKGNSREEAAS